MNASALLAGPDAQAILNPVLAMLLLAFIVWIALFATRFKAIAATGLKAEDLSTPEDVQKQLPRYALNPAYNFKNLFEVPVLFVTLCFYLYLTGTADSTHITCAWIFVGFRYLHSAVQCSYNNVNHRFLIYLVSSIALWVMLARAILAAI